MIVNQARDRHRSRERVSRREREANVLQAQRHLEPCRLILLVGDDRPIGLVGGGREQRVGQDFQIKMRLNSTFADQREGLAFGLLRNGITDVNTGSTMCRARS